MKKEKFMIVLLVLIIVLLVGYIVYDKGIFSQNTEKENTKEEQKNNVEISNNLLTEQEALALGNELWLYTIDALLNNDRVWKQHVSEEKNQYGGNEFICDTTAQEIIAKFTQDFKVEECLMDNRCDTNSLDYFIQPNDDCHSMSGKGRGSNQLYNDTTLSIKNIQENQIVFTATSSYCDTSFCPNGSKITKTIEKDFIIKKENNNWLIHYFYLPN